MLECKKVPSLVDLCVQKWVNNVWLLGDVGETDEYLLDRMLPLCTVDQLKHVEESTKGRDLSPVTDKLWKKFYEKQFGNTNEVVENMRKNQVSYKWMQLYEEKMREIQALKRMRRLCLYEYEVAYSGAGYNGSNLKAKEEIDSLNSEEGEEEEEEEEEEAHDEEEVEEVEWEEVVEEKEEAEETQLEAEEVEEDEDKSEEEEEDDDGYGDDCYDDDYDYDYDYDYT